MDGSDITAQRKALNILNRGKTVQMKPITAYLDPEVEPGQANNTEQEEQEIDTTISLDARRKNIVQEFEKVKVAFRQFQEDICKTFGASRTTTLRKIGLLETGQNKFNQKNDKIRNQVTILENKNSNLDKAFRLLEEDFKHLEDDTDDLQKVLENGDNNLQKII